MNQRRCFLLTKWILIVGLAFIWWGNAALGADLPEVKEKGVLRHLGVPYANFVTGSGDGLDVDLVKLFAQHLGVQYQWVKTSWPEFAGDLTGKRVKPKGNEVEILGEVPIKGDLAAHGITVLPWREKIMDFVPDFPTQIWLMARADSTLKPVKPSGNLKKDIARVKALLKGHQVLGLSNTCLDTGLYGLEKGGSQCIAFKGSLNEMVPAIMKGEAETTLMDVLDALLALEKWPGKVKVIGPVSEVQMMAVAFPKTSPKLREAFQQFMEQCKKDGTYARLAEKYEPDFYRKFPEFFKDFK
ncbi:MAG: transporter substrate-binding domain-containing protein [Proteobacteria bacterium]|nr:transporter substrate-binding domain-containing protein [Pseudomonadota bacterium]MBU4354151.1 transporter substrate-binding domain-containing protein [Pseudomonadota bacterium]MBU4448825.1 transporter substrate-binding domain-containing protein [Pseudomonadota bacterium]